MASEEGDYDAKSNAATVGNNKVAAQINRLKEANNKYKSLLKLAKERITKQDEEMEALKGTFYHFVARMAMHSKVQP